MKVEELPTKDVEMKDVTNTEYTEEMKLEGAEGGGAEKKKPSWLNRSKEGGIKKLPKEVVRRRRNFRLKKMLTPKVSNPTEVQLIKLCSRPLLWSSTSSWARQKLSMR